MTTQEDIPEATELAPRAPVRRDAPTFAELGARAETVAALESVGIIRSFAIQEYAIPIALRGADLIGQAPTGTGKTLGFGVPLLQRVLAPSEGSDGIPQALVVVPTRELGLQVARDIAAAGKTRGVRVLPVYGGVAYEPQTDALKTGVEIIVGTPGRLLDLAKSKQLRLDQVGALVLDEADRMLDLGFLDDVEKILAMLPAKRQTMLFSATMPEPIIKLSRRFLQNPVTIHAAHTAETGPSPLTRQLVYRTHSMNKMEMVARILQAKDRGLTMIFTRTKRAADRLAEDLDARGFAVAAVHGDLGQGARERALRAFRVGKIDVLVATDVAARGLDVTGVTHVINYDCPEDADTYTHRIGRTGRAGASGVAITFVDWEDMPRWRLIDKSQGLDMPEPPETYHTSPQLFADLEIASSVTGTLPSAARTRAGLTAEKLEDIEIHHNDRRERGGRPARGRGDQPRRQRRRITGPEGDAAAPESAAQEPNDTATVRPRRRRGRPGGSAAGDGAPSADTAQVPAPDGGQAATAPPAFSDAGVTGDSGDAPARRRPRRRSRGGANGPADTVSGTGTPAA